MVGGIFYEHGHRLIASTVGFLTIGLVIFSGASSRAAGCGASASSRSASSFSRACSAASTVLYLLPDGVSIGHAGLAQIFFCLTVSLALFTSPTWRRRRPSRSDDARLRRRFVVLTVVRVPADSARRDDAAHGRRPRDSDFPVVERASPAADLDARDCDSFRPSRRRAGRDGRRPHERGVIWSRHGSRPELVRPSWLLVLAVSAQITLGALVVLSGKQPIVNTLHVATGALVIATSLVLTLRAFRTRIEATRAVSSPAAIRLRHA